MLQSEEVGEPDEVPVMKIEEINTEEDDIENTDNELDQLEQAPDVKDLPDPVSKQPLAEENPTFFLEVSEPAQ